MDRIKLILVYLSFGLSFIFANGQEIGNYVNNGSFEDTIQSFYVFPKHWSAADSAATLIYGELLMTPSRVPLCGYTYQWPKHGKNHLIALQYCSTCPANKRAYPKNRMKQTLQAGKEYCVTMYVNLSNQSTHGIDGIGVYFGGNSLDTISKCMLPIPYLTPQIMNPVNILLTDTLNWMQISGTFSATGLEKYLLLGNFRNDANTNIVLVNPTNLPANAADYLFDAISVIEKNLPAYAGPDKLLYLSDSVFIGRQPDWAIDPGCIWYKLPNMTTAIDTISGLWVKPIVTSTYVVRQELDCSSVKWDTVVVRINTNLVDIDKLKALADDITLSPNPTSSNLKITFGMQTISDFSSYEIVNALGQLILKGQLQKNTADISTQDIAPGLYDIKLVCEFGTVTKKFVKTAD